MQDMLGPRRVVGTWKGFPWLSPLASSGIASSLWPPSASLFDYFACDILYAGAIISNVLPGAISCTYDKTSIWLWDLKDPKRSHVERKYRSEHLCMTWSVAYPVRYGAIQIIIFLPAITHTSPPLYIPLPLEESLVRIQVCLSWQ